MYYREHRVRLATGISARGTGTLETKVFGVYLKEDHQYSACKITSPNTICSLGRQLT